MSYFANLQKSVSAGSIIASRVAIQDENHVFYAVDNQVYHVAVEFPEIGNAKQTLMHINQKSLSSTLKNEIQNVKYHQNSSRLGAIDSSGNIQIFLNPEYKEEQDKKMKNYDLLPCNTSPFGSKGPSSLAFSLDTKYIASTRFFYKDVTIYQDDKIVREHHCENHPTALKWMKVQKSEHLVFCEYNRLMMIDQRDKKPVALGSVTNGCLYALSNTNDVIVAAGEDRTVYIFDIRNTNSVSKWDNCLKYSISFLDVQDSTYFVGSYESTEFRYGKVNSNEKTGFSADSRWIGLDRRGDMIAGVSEQGKVYIKK